MDPRLSRAGRLGRAVVDEARAEKITFLAGSLAYHAFISLLPLMVLVLVAINTLGSESLETGFLALVRSLLSPGGRDAALAELFVTELRTASQSAGLSVIGGAVLLWGTMRIFRGLDTAFSDVYETESANTLLDQLGDAVVVLVAFAAAVVGAGLLQRLLPGGAVVSVLALVGSLALTLYPIYYVFPDTDVTPFEVVPGTLFTAVGLTLLESLFSFYLALAGGGTQPTVISGVLVLLTWLYFASLVLLLGVVVNAVLANRSQDIDVVPLFGDAPHPGESADDRSRLVTGLQQLESAAESGDSVSIAFGDEQVTLPAPLHVEADTRAAGFHFGGGQLGLTMRWVAGPETGDGGDDGGDSDGDDDEPSDDAATPTERTERFCASRPPPRTMYLSHPVRRIREDPGEGEVSLVVELEGSGEGEVPDALAAAVDDAGGAVERALGYDCWQVTVPETGVERLCSLENVVRIETAATLELGVDDDSTKGG